MGRIEACMAVLRDVTCTDYTVQWAADYCTGVLGVTMTLADARAALARMAYNGDVVVTGRFVQRVIG